MQSYNTSNISLKQIYFDSPQFNCQVIAVALTVIFAAGTIFFGITSGPSIGFVMCASITGASTIAFAALAISSIRHCQSELKKRKAPLENQESKGADALQSGRQLEKKEVAHRQKEIVDDNGIGVGVGFNKKEVVVVLQEPVAIPQTPEVIQEKQEVVEQTPEVIPQTPEVIEQKQEVIQEKPAVVQHVKSAISSDDDLLPSKAISPENHRQLMKLNNGGSFTQNYFLSEFHKPIKNRTPANGFDQFLRDMDGIAFNFNGKNPDLQAPIIYRFPFRNHDLTPTNHTMFEKFERCTDFSYALRKSVQIDDELVNHILAIQSKSSSFKDFKNEWSKYAKANAISDKIKDNVIEAAKVFTVHAYYQDLYRFSNETDAIQSLQIFHQGLFATTLAELFSIYAYGDDYTISPDTKNDPIINLRLNETTNSVEFVLKNKFYITHNKADGLENEYTIDPEILVDLGANTYTATWGKPKKIEPEQKTLEQAQTS